MREESYCKNCNKTKNIDNFYNCNLSLCKDCKKNISKNYRKNNKHENDIINIINTMNKNIEFLMLKTNSLEILIKEANKKNNREKVILNLND